MSEGQIRIEYVALSDIRRWPRNPKLHNLDHLGKSVERFGFVQPLLVDERTGQLVAGHGRLETLQALKEVGKEPPGRVQVRADEWLVPVVRGVSFKDDAEAEAYLIADNRMVELGGWDGEMLVSMLKDVSDFSGSGFRQEDVAAMLEHVARTCVPDGFQPASISDVPRLDEKRLVVCPKCGHGFTP